MSSILVNRDEIQKLLDRVSGLTEKDGDPRLKLIIREILSDLYATIDRFDISPEEFWAVLDFLQSGAGEFGLMAPGLGFDRYLDIRLDEADQAAGLIGGTSRAIEGPLYVPGAPLSKCEARLDDGTENGEILIMHGRVLDVEGRPIQGAIVDVWHANTRGTYSHFDPSQPPYNLRRRIETGENGDYKFRTILPSGYAVPPGGATERLMRSIGRHGKRPAHIHFFVSASGRRHLTTQINIAGDPLLFADFAQATRDELVPDIVRREDLESIRAAGLGDPFAEISFDFTLFEAASEDDLQPHARPRAPAFA